MLQKTQFTLNLTLPQFENNLKIGLLLIEKDHILKILRDVDIRNASVIDKLLGRFLGDGASVPAKMYFQYFSISQLICWLFQIGKG